jgi:hypothetical protein
LLYTQVTQGSPTLQKQRHADEVHSTILSLVAALLLGSYASYNPVEFCFSEIKAAFRPLRLSGGDLITDVKSCVANLRFAEAYFSHAEKEWLKDKLGAGLAA